MAASQNVRLLVEQCDDALASEYDEWFPRQERDACGPVSAFLPPQRLPTQHASLGDQAERCLTSGAPLYGFATPGSHSG
ncbi:MAG TPA: hypothetical protein VF792_03115 [Ktedonobacterales bacterium]